MCRHQLVGRFLLMCEASTALLCCPPATVFAPTRLSAPEALLPASTAVGVAAVPSAAAPSPPTDRGAFDELAAGLLAAASPGRSQFAAAGADPSYDFDEYVMLRSSGAPYYSDPSENLIDPLTLGSTGSAARYSTV